MRTAIITGGGSGIGRATAIKLAGMGFAVALAGRTRSKLEKVANEITKAGGEKPLVVVADVSRPADIDRLVKHVLKQWRRIDVLVNNAGYAPSSPTHKMTPRMWQDIIDINLSAVFHASRLVWPAMSRQKSGVIINISSMAARDPFPGLGAYAAAKSGVNMLTLSMAREGDPLGIRVVGIAPAGVDTPMFRELVGEKNVKRDEILATENVADAIAQAIEGGLRYASGETIYIHRHGA